MEIRFKYDYASSPQQCRVESIKNGTETHTFTGSRVYESEAAALIHAAVELEIQHSAKKSFSRDEVDDITKMTLRMIGSDSAY